MAHNPEMLREIAALQQLIRTNEFKEREKWYQEKKKEVNNV